MRIKLIPFLLVTALAINVNAANAKEISSKKCLVAEFPVTKHLNKIKVFKEIDNLLQAKKDIFDGLWGWEKDTETTNFSITLKRVGTDLSGVYCYSADNGDKADCPTDEKVSFLIPYPTGYSFTVAFSSNNSNVKGIVKISIIGKSLTWDVMKIPGKGFLCPIKAKLIKDKVE